MTETVLFVGGSADGRRWVKDNTRDYIDIPVMKGKVEWTDSPERMPITLERYIRVAPHTYLISTVSPANLIPLLIEGYRRAK